MVALQKSIKEQETLECEYTREQLANSKRFAGKKDVLNAVLGRFPDNQTFTVNAVEKMITDFYERTGE